VLWLNGGKDGTYPPHYLFAVGDSSCDPWSKETYVLMGVSLRVAQQPSCGDACGSWLLGALGLAI
jgi:hypothetical protein